MIEHLPAQLTGIGTPCPMNAYANEHLEFGRQQRMGRHTGDLAADYAAHRRLCDQQETGEAQRQADWWYAKRATPQQQADVRREGYQRLVPDKEKIEIKKTIRELGS